MNLQVVYCSHRSTNLETRERIAFSNDDQLRDAYVQLGNRFPAAEAVVLSTCNRVELYTAQEAVDDPPTHKQLARFFAEFHGIPLESFADDLNSRTGRDAVRHLFCVASSVDSMVLGEPQIVNQVKHAYSLAQREEACGPLTHAMFQAAIRVSKRVRTETTLAEGRVSIASVAVGEIGKSIFDRFDNKVVLIIGAGEMAEETMRYLQAMPGGVGRVLVVNRSPDAARNLVERIGCGESHPLDELDKWMSVADVIVSTTGAAAPIVSAERFRATRAECDWKPVFILDLGAPRDFEREVSDVDDNVYLFDIDYLEKTCADNHHARQKQIARAYRVIDDEADRFMHDIHHRATGPIVRRLREKVHDLSRDEMAQLRTRLGHLGQQDMEQIERSVERLINKLLHPPLEALRDEAREGTPHGLMDALKRLFHLRD